MMNKLARRLEVSWKGVEIHLVVLQTGISVRGGMGAAGRVCCWLTWVKYNLLLSSVTKPKELSLAPCEVVFAIPFEVCSVLPTHILLITLKLNVSWLTIGLYLHTKYVNQAHTHWDSRWVAAGTYAGAPEEGSCSLFLSHPSPASPRYLPPGGEGWKQEPRKVLRSPILDVLDKLQIAC